MSQENVEVVQRAMDLVEQGELSSIFTLGLATPDAEVRPAFEFPGARTHLGLDGWTEFMRTWTESFGAREMHTERVVDGGDEVVVVYGERARGKASGVAVEMFLGAVVVLEDFKIKRVQLYVDPEEALEAAGLSE